MDDSGIRYHFMHKVRQVVTNEIVLHFMDFKGARILYISENELKTTTNEKLKEDALKQWDRIEKAHAMAQMNNNPYK